MILKNERECALQCSICGELEGVSPKAMANEAVLAVLMARVAQQHAGCEQFAGNPGRARAERQYKARMRSEMHAAALA